MIYQLIQLIQTKLLSYLVFFFSYYLTLLYEIKNYIYFVYYYYYNDRLLSIRPWFDWCIITFIIFHAQTDWNAKLQHNSADLALQTSPQSRASATWYLFGRRNELLNSPWQRNKLGRRQPLQESILEWQQCTGYVKLETDTFGHPKLPASK